MRNGPGNPSITPAVTTISHNFIISNYNGHEAIDNDDASEYFDTHSNVFVYGANGLKSDFGGQCRSTGGVLSLCLCKPLHGEMGFVVLYY